MEVKDVDYAYYVTIVDNHGWDALLSHLQRIYPQFGLYSVSQSWYQHKRYILKARGTNGDLIIQFA